MKEKLNKHIARSSNIKIYLDIEGEKNTFHGIPVLLSGSLVAFHELYEFHFFGYRIVPLKYIAKIRRSKHETTYQRILKSTGELKSHTTPSWLRIRSWKSLFTSLKKNEICACVETANVFAIGEIHANTDKAVVLNSFDSHGEWCNPKHKIKYSEISEVSFGGEYSETFNNYMKNK